MIEVHSDLVKEFKHWVFPGGEVGVKFEFNDLIFNTETIRVVWMVKFKDDLHKDFFIVANAIDAIRENFGSNVKINLEIPYLPYARQDRVCSIGEAFSLKVFAGMIRSLDHNLLITQDVHNLKSYYSLFGARAFNVPQHECAKNLPKYDYLIAPDKGASEKVQLHDQVLHSDTKIIIMDKVRKDGQITYNAEYEIPKGSSVCVVDDLSDGNGTFIALANSLNHKDFSVFDLYVTHGLFSKGLDNIRNIYDTVYCKNLMNESIKHDRMLEILG